MLKYKYEYNENIKSSIYHLIPQSICLIV